MTTPASSNTRPAWFVGASFGGVDDQTERFLERGIWENGYTHDDTSAHAVRQMNLVKQVQPGDRIAIKAAYPPTGELPFDSLGNTVSGMVIKAIGVVKQNMGDGRLLEVDWTSVEPPRPWYFSSYWHTIHEVMPGEWKTDALIAFTFEGQTQDYDRWRNDPQYRERFGDRNTPHPQSPPDQLPPLQTTDTYVITTILTDGCFLPHSTLDTILRRLQTKQNIILQGPPGTGKTWLAKRLAYALIGRKDDSKVRSFQFHPNMSYEDFVRGWRPDGKGGLVLADGPFLQLCDAARQDPGGKYVIVIEEINRGNPASTFGELLTLLESDKRNPADALALAYPREPGERFHVPPNVYVIGTMNTADRSIAMIDLALRRRFAFFDLEPVFGDVWRDWVHEQTGIPTAFLSDVELRLTALNDQIANDRNLGRQFRIGHSHVTPPPNTIIDDHTNWFTEIVETEIAPLLREYWFDDVTTADEAESALLAGLQ